MALEPIDDKHALQIQAGTLGRKTGHDFEGKIASEINNLEYPAKFETRVNEHVRNGNPALLLLDYISSVYKIPQIQRATAISTGALATSESGKRWLEINGVQVRRCKSDLIISIHGSENKLTTVGISTKQCNNKNPTNAQLYFTTARSFATLLSQNGFTVSDKAITAMRQFCGDNGFRPSDDPLSAEDRAVDTRRYFWEEIDHVGRCEWERIFTDHQDEVSRLLLQKAYIDDPFIPDLVLHKTKKSESWGRTEVAIYTVSELISHSRAYGGFRTKSYSVKKGSFKDPQGVTHLAPRFGIIQMQRGGQAQHPEQLQFNLEAGYFYKTGQQRSQVQSDFLSE